MQKKKKAYHHGDLRSKLLEEATRIIAEKGVEAVTMRELARRCGVSRTAPYRHFDEKTALLAAVAEEGFLRLEAETHRARTESKGDASLAIRNCFLAYVDFAIKNPTQYRLMFSREIRNLFKHPGLLAASKATFDELLDVVRMGQKTGQLKPGQTLELALIMWSHAHGLSTLVIDGFVKQVRNVRLLSELACQVNLEGIPAAAPGPRNSRTSGDDSPADGPSRPPVRKAAG